MLAFAEARRGCSEMLPAEVDMRGINGTAYVLGASGKPHSVVIVNRDGTQSAAVSVRDLAMGDVIALRLAAPTPESKSGVTFGGSPVDANGHWTAASKERIRDGVIAVPPMSAVVLRAARTHA
jgi:hypothetical protein